MVTRIFGEGDTVILTKKLIDAASYAGTAYANGAQARQVLWDDEVPGFGCRLLPSGKKSFSCPIARRDGSGK